MALAASIGALGGIGSAVLGAASSSRAAARAYEYSRLLQEHQYDLNRKAIREYYTNNRYSLESAGYNPLLGLAGSTAQGFSASANMSPTENNLATDFNNGVNSAMSMQQSVQNLKQTKAQVDNIKADTDVKKYGRKGAVLKNLLELADKNKNNPTIRKAIEGQVVGMSPVYSAQSSLQDFKNNHPTTLTVLRKLKQGDFRGAKYAMDLRRERILKNMSHSANSSRLSDVNSDDWYGSISHKEYRKTNNYKNKPPRSFPSGM